MKLFRFLTFLAIFLFIEAYIVGQNEVIEGIVIDKQTNKPLSFVNIVYNIKNQGFITNIDGKFTIKDISKIEFLKFNYVGYQSKILNKEFLLQNRQLTVYLLEENYNLNEVTIYPGENPAHRIINNVIENRNINDPEKLSSYSYTSYNKMYFTVDADDLKKVEIDKTKLTDTLKQDSDIIELKKFIDNQYILFMESVTERSYKNPDKYNEKVIASRVSGLKEPSFILLATQMQSFSFYSQIITLLDSRYVSPISNGSTNRYFFNIEDTTYNEKGDTIFSISFKPKQGRNFEALQGILNINTNKYAIQSVVAEPFGGNGLIDLKIVQNYQMVDNEHWFPVELNTDLIFSGLFEAQIDKTKMKIISRGKTYLKNIKINPNLENVQFKAIELDMDKKNFSENDTLLSKNRIDSLSAKELQTYKVIDSIGEIVHLDLKMQFMKNLMFGYLPLFFLDIGINNLFNYNEFEGFITGVGIRTNQKISKLFSIGIYSKYGFDDKKWKYGGNIDLNLSKDKQTNLSLSYKKDIFESSSTNYFESKSSPLSSESIREILVFDMTYFDEYKSNLSFKVFKKLRVNLFARELAFKNTMGYHFYNNGDFGPDSLTYHSRDFGLQFKYAPDESLASMDNELFTLKSNSSPEVFFNLIRGFKSTLSDFDYLKLETKINIHFMTKQFGLTNIQLNGTKVFGDLPYFLLYSGYGSFSDFSVEAANSFQTMRLNEFLSDEFVSIHYRQDFGGLLFKGEKFRPKLVFCNSIGYGRLEKLWLHQGINFKTMEKGYFETGFIVNNLLRFYNFIGWGFGVFYRYGPYSFSNISNNFAYKLTLTFEL